nr:reverse transcriptase [Tanacetum cinerariifolium]
MLYGVGIDERLACVWGDDLGCSIGHVVLLKSVLNSLPLYFMSLFQVPVGVMEEIEKIRRSFFWGKALGERNLCIMDWGTITKSKPNEGLDVGNLRVTNKALLCKWVWRYENKKEALWRKAIDAKYGRIKHSLSPSIPSKALVSLVWKKITDILHSMSPSGVVAKKGLVHCIGKANKLGPVCDSGLWKMVNGNGRNDKVVWSFDYLGKFSSRSFGKEMENSSYSDPLLHSNQSNCPLCNSCIESVDHLFIHYSNVAEVMAIKEACRMVNENLHLSASRIIVESDSLNAVS